MRKLLKTFLRQLTRAFLEFNKSEADKRSKKDRLTVEKYIEETDGVKDLVFSEISNMFFDDSDGYFALQEIGSPIGNKNGSIIQQNNKFYIQEGTHFTTWAENNKTQQIQKKPVYFVSDIETGVECWVCFCWTGSMQPSASLIVYATKEHLSTACDMVKELCWKNSLYRGKILAIDFESGKDMVIRDPEAKDAVLNNEQLHQLGWLKSIITNWDKLAPEQRRQGIILHGPPGVGKSSCVSRLARELKGICTIAYISSFDSRDLGTVYTWLTRLGKSIVVIEDIDSMQADRESTDQSPGTSVLLHVLDGEEGFEVITITTTNYPEKMDDALTRPGRLGTSIAFTYPDMNHKKDIIAHYQKKYGINLNPENILEEYFSAETISGAHIQAMMADAHMEKMLGRTEEEALEAASTRHLGKFASKKAKTGESKPKLTFGFNKK